MIHKSGLPMYIRKGKKYHPDEIVSLIGQFGRKKRVLVDGDLVTIKSTALLTFKISGTQCCCCGVRGLYFVKERARFGNRGDGGFSFHLYAQRGDGVEVMMTSDHIKPLKRKGARKALNNRQTLCSYCNGIKGCKKISNEKLRKLVDEKKAGRAHKAKRSKRIHKSL